MFETIIKSPAGSPRRWLSMGVSASIQAALLGTVVVSTLYATDALPDTPDMMAFVVVAPPPPPPPPPPAPLAVKPAPEKVVSPGQPQPIAPEPIVTAPVEAPAAIAPETGREADVFAPIQPGFEKGAAGVIGGVVGGIDTALPAPPPAPVRIGGSVAAPRLIRRVEPEYPAIAQSANIEGLVILEAKVNAGGHVEEVTVLRSNSILDQAAIDALKQWKYEPLMFHGRATPFVLTVTLSFSLTR